MNALRDFAGILGGAADAVFLGGAVGKTNRRNAFADYIGKGDYAAAEQLALRNGEGGYAQLAQQKAAGATAAQEREAAKQKEQFEFIQRSAAFLDTLTPEQQKVYLDVNGRGLIAQGVLDEDDLPLLYQNIGVAGGFTGLAQTSLGVQAQFDNSLNTRKQGEVERSAQATERLRGGELAVSQGNLALGRDRLSFDQQQAPLNRQQEQRKLGREDFKDTQSLRKEFSQITSDYTDASGSYDRIKTLSSVKTSQADLALIVAFTKLLDPGSVAREGEVQLTQSSASAVQQATNWLNRLSTGNTILPDKVREEFVRAADEIKKSYDKSFQLRSDEFSQIANDAGLNPERVIIGGPAKIAAGSGAQQFDPSLLDYMTPEERALFNGQ